MLNNLKLQFTKTPNFIFFSLIPFFIGTLGLILLASFRDKLSSLDQGIAKFAQSQTTTDSEFYPFNTGSIKFLNDYLLTVIIIPLLTLVIQLIVDMVYLKMHFKRHIHFYLHVILSSGAYIVLVELLMVILKVTFKRPRPLQTIQYAPNFTPDNQRQCLQEYCVGYTLCNRPNVCKLSLESCPSGHTSTVAGLVYLSLYISIIDYLYTKAELYKERFYSIPYKVNIAIKLAIISANVLISTIFIPIVMIARMMVLKHFFTDVFGGLCIAVLFIPILMIMQPQLPFNENNYQIVARNKA